VCRLPQPVSPAIGRFGFHRFRRRQNARRNNQPARTAVVRASRRLDHRCASAQGADRYRCRQQCHKDNRKKLIDISILSDDFLAEVRDSDKKNLAVEALKKLINGEVRSQAKRNVTQSKAFSERLEAAILRYHNNALTTAQVLEELIQLAKDMR
jgi:hypothetical protein